MQNYYGKWLYIKMAAVAKQIVGASMWREFSCINADKDLH